jgi:GNAT superfamily N-acetyltransferase
VTERIVVSSVRPARPGDAPRLTPLLAQLGYDVPLAQVERSIADAGGEYRILIAEAGGEPAGMLEVRVAPASITVRRHAFVSAVVVDQRLRSAGVGAALVAAAERWAIERGCESIQLRTNVVRERAHAFYERLGYGRKKSQHLYVKRLGTD